MSQSIQLSSVFSYRSLVHAIAGAAGGIVAMTTFYPLDTVRYRLQVEAPEKRKSLNTWSIIIQLINEEGFETLYRGIIPVLQSLCISNFVYFYSYNSLKALTSNPTSSTVLTKHNALKDLLLGTVSGIINVLTTTPFWVVNSRLKMKGVKEGYGTTENNKIENLKRKHNDINDDYCKEYSGLLDGLYYIWKAEGIIGLWAGTSLSMLLVINPALQFMMYDYLKVIALGDTLKSPIISIKALRAQSPSAFTLFTIGAISKAFATILTYPLQVIQSKLRHGNTDKNLNLSGNYGVCEMIVTIFHRYGFLGLFRGLEAKLLQTVLTAALMFTAYEKIVRFVMSILIRRKH